VERSILWTRLVGFGNEPNLAPSKSDRSQGRHGSASPWLCP